MGTLWSTQDEEGGRQGDAKGSGEGTFKGTELELAHKDQGYHEMEFCEGDNESQLHDKVTHCTKNPQHLQFIPAKEFTMEHLPEQWRDGLFFDYITTKTSLVVRLSVGYTSKDRPLNYPLHNRGGRLGIRAFGTGWVQSIFRKFSEEDNRTCPCTICEGSPQKARKQWGEFRVATAKHVVFDTSEAEHTTCDVFYDCDDDKQTCPKLEVLMVWYSTIEDDYCFLKCISHDEDVSKRLEEMVDNYNDLSKKLEEKYKGSGFLDKKTAVVISHPHGRSKHVSVGVLTGRPDEDTRYNKYKYSAETCPGSSGAPVTLLTGWLLSGKLELCNATHSGSRGKGCNESTGWWFTKDALGV